MTDLQFPLRSAFLAVPLEVPAKWQFQAYAEELKQYEFLTIQKTDTPHLTLYFWKELLKIEYDDVMGKAEKIAARSVPFQLKINGADTFGRKGDERVLFLTVAFSPELATLKKNCPWPNPPGQDFHPHITLARIGHPQRFDVQKKKIKKSLENIDIMMDVSMIRFYANVDGHKQTPVRDFPFTQL